MNSSLIGKIEKAKRYAQEPERVTFLQFQAQFNGENDAHTVTYEDQHLHCTCDFFEERLMCSHTMAFERLLGVMLPQEAQSGVMRS